MSDKTREEFEFWASDEGAHPDAVERSGECYILAQIQAYWVAWLASKEKYEPRWISVDESLPKDGEAVLICSWDENWLDNNEYNEEDANDRNLQWVGGFRYQHVARRSSLGRCWEVNFSTGSLHNSAYVSINFRDFEDGVFPITHWMPLPPAPSTQGGGE